MNVYICNSISLLLSLCFYSILIVILSDKLSFLDKVQDFPWSSEIHCITIILPTVMHLARIISFFISRSTFSFSTSFAPSFSMVSVVISRAQKTKKEKHVKNRLCKILQHFQNTLSILRNLIMQIRCLSNYYRKRITYLKNRIQWLLAIVGYVLQLFCTVLYLTYKSLYILHSIKI